mgnify:CR=1 FL=1
MTYTPEVAEKDLQIRRKVVKACIWKSCVNCLNWAPNENKGAEEVCSLYKARPPADVIVIGCVSHIEDIPF